jgi:hypothetical protein
MIVENKENGLGEPTTFDFKYIPSYSMMSTELGEYKGSGTKKRRIERRNLRTLLIASAVLGIGSYFWARTVWSMVRYAEALWYSF